MADWTTKAMGKGVMNMPGTSRPADADGRDEKCRSPWFPVKVAAAALAALSVIDALMGTFTDYYFFPQFSFCSSVWPGEPYDLVLNDRPCRITSDSLLDFFGVFAITSFMYQIPALVLWAVVAYRERRRKRSSPYFPVLVLATATFVAAFCWDVLDFWGPFEKNTQGEYCDYVEPGEPYHLILNDVPCRVTGQFFLEFGLFLVAANILLQIPTLIVWATIAGREGRRRRRQSMADAAVQAGKFAEFIRTLRHGPPGRER